MKGWSLFNISVPLPEIGWQVQLPLEAPLRLLGGQTQPLNIPEDKDSSVRQKVSKLKKKAKEWVIETPFAQLKVEPFQRRCHCHPLIFRWRVLSATMYINKDGVKMGNMPFASHVDRVEPRNSPLHSWYHMQFVLWLYSFEVKCLQGSSWTKKHWDIVPLSLPPLPFFAGAVSLP